MDDVPLIVKVWGDWACFTRPEFKVERVSYPMMTPSAARGVLEAIFWKPEFRWEVREIWTLAPVRYFSILRNEIKTRQSFRTAQGWQQKNDGFDATDDRAERHTVGLRDVAYAIIALPRLQPGVSADIAKYRDQFRRRVQQGRCFATPYLGCREFSASFSPLGPDDRPEPVSFDIGQMLREIAYRKGGTGAGTPRFFDASVQQGVLRVPPEGESDAACPCRF